MNIEMIASHCGLPVARISNAATMIPADETASPIMCTNAPRMFTSSRLSCLSETAVAPFTISAMAAMISISEVSTGRGASNRSYASRKTKNVNATSIAALMNAARIPAR